MPVQYLPRRDWDAHRDERIISEWDASIACATSGTMMPGSMHCSGIISYGAQPVVERQLVVKCEYCGTRETEKQKHQCVSCGAPLPWEKACVMPG